ncbi:MAG: hypothetical protein ACYDAE_02780 [Steroidobacteraceae bacterium]
MAGVQAHKRVHDRKWPTLHDANSQVTRQFRAGDELMHALRIFTRGSAALAAALLLALTLGAAARDSSSRHDELAAWVGHWKVRIETKETQFGHARTDDYDGKCSILPHGSFLVCEYLSLQPDPDSGRILNDVVLIYYSDVDKTFKFTNVAPEGGPFESVLHVDGNVWTRPYKVSSRGGGVVDAREIWTFISRDKQLARLEMSADKGVHWTVVNEAVGTRER